MIAGGFLIPEGSGHTPIQWLEVLQQDQSEAYGKAGKTVCGFLDREKGLCRAYGYRNSACSTYFCKHDAKWGETFWEYVHHWLGRSELALTQWSLKQVGFDFASYLKNFEKLSSQAMDVICCTQTKSWKKESLKKLFISQLFI